MPDTSECSPKTGSYTRWASSEVMPYAAIGTPPAIGLPMVNRSGSSPQATVAPPGPTQIVWVSSMQSSVPWARVRRRSSAW